jgi:hypothetical protein
MRALILDKSALLAVSPSSLAAYAREEGWQRTEPYGIHSDVYEAPGKPEIVLPRTDRLGDYSTVVSKLLDIFSVAADTDELTTYRTLLGTDRDVVRLRSPDHGDDGSVDLNTGVELVYQARQMLLAAACAAKHPHSVYRAGANREASEYMRRVKLGQTEQGSFVVALLAPVPPVLQVGVHHQWAGWEDEPFERQVTRRLGDALRACRNAIELATTGNGLDAFESAVQVGVSANLCEAIATVVEQTNQLDISLTWAKTRPAPESSRTIRFSQSDGEVLKEAARTYRARHPKPDVMLFATVKQLRRDQHEIEGLVTLKAIVDDRQQSVRAVLDQANYSIAVQAHDTKAPVVVRGDLERVGQRWQLTNATIREMLTASDDEDEFS